jgi:UDP-N-acetylglucosamine:LPS N-acetylglucosamine transferase
MNKLGQELFVLGSLNIKVGNAKPSEIQNEIEANLRKLVEKQAACINMLESNMQEYRNQLAELNNHSRKIMEAYLQERKLQPTPRFIDSKL